ncbi:MAG TPA: LUD domain-containing protein, partial [Arenibaculum sp.]|nr:LUD domain-containing protein [Arenibaculum sp.]
MTGDARTDMLARIRNALRDVPEGERAQEVPVARGYRRHAEAGPAELADLFARRAADYKVIVHRIGPEDVAARAAGICAGRGARRLVVPRDLPAHWRPGGLELVEDADLRNADLDGMDGVMTGCAVAIAETGTVVLDSGAGQGRRAITLIPDWHLCVVPAERIVGLVPEAIARLEEAVRDAKRPITFVSGPSATSDIELNRVEGVHGPR